MNPHHPGEYEYVSLRSRRNAAKKLKPIKRPHPLPHPAPLDNRPDLDEIRAVVSKALTAAGFSPTAVHFMIRPDYAYVHTAVAGTSYATQDELLSGHTYLIVGVNDRISDEQGFLPDVRRP